MNSHRYYISSEDESETEGGEEGGEEVVEPEKKNADEDVKSSAESEGGESEGVDVNKLYKQKPGTTMQRYV